MFFILSKGKAVKAALISGAVILTVVAAFTVSFIYNSLGADKEDFSLKAGSTEEIAAFLGQFGYEADKTVSSREIVMPLKGDPVFSDMAEKLKTAGYEFYKTAGKPCTEKIVSLKSEEIKEEHPYAMLYIHKGKVRGAFVTTFEEGFEPVVLEIKG